MQQIDPQRVLAAQQKKANDGVAGVYLGQQAFLVSVYALAEGAAQQEKTEIRQE